MMMMMSSGVEFTGVAMAAILFEQHDEIRHFIKSKLAITTWTVCSS